MTPRSSVVMTHSKSTLSGNARPFVPNPQTKHLQQQPQPQQHYGFGQFLAHLNDTYPSSSTTSTRSLPDEKRHGVRGGSKRPAAQLSSEAQAIASNNAFLLGQNLLTAYKDLETFRRGQERGSVGIISETMATALQTHPDPVMFIVNALITVGTVAGFKNLDPVFELAVSEFFVLVLQQFLEWYHDHAEEWAMAVKSTTVTVTGSTSHSKTSSQSFASTAMAPGFLLDDDDPIPSSYPHHPEIDLIGPEIDLIILDDDRLDTAGTIPSTLQLRSIQPQQTGSSSNTSLLDDDLIAPSPSLLQVAVLKPVVKDLISLTDFDTTRPVKSPSSASVPSLLPPFRDVDKNNKKLDLLTDDNEFGMNESKADKVDLMKLEETRKYVNEQEQTFEKQEEEDSSPDMHDLLDVGNSNLCSTRRVSSQHDQTKKDDGTEADKGDTTVKEKILEKEHRVDNIEPVETLVVENAREAKAEEEEKEEEEEEEPGLIQQRHRGKLLDEIPGGNNLLQVFAVLDILKMRASLRKPIKDGEGETYGWSLARQLYKRGLFRESSVVIFEYLENDDEDSGSDPSWSSRSNFAASGSMNTNKGIKTTKDSHVPTLRTLSTPSTLPPPPSFPAQPVLQKRPYPFYKLPSDVQIIMVDSDEQLGELAFSLKNSTIVGMDTEWLPNVKQYRGLRPGTRTAIMQLACNADSTVYIVDTVAFLNSPDFGEQLVQVIGEFFNNPKTLKLAYDWDGDHELLIETFPSLHQEHFRPRNFLDLKHVWIKSSSNSNGDAGSNSNSNGDSSDSNSVNSSIHGNGNRSGGSDRSMSSLFGIRKHGNVINSNVGHLKSASSQTPGTTTTEAEEFSSRSASTSMPGSPTMSSCSLPSSSTTVTHSKLEENPGPEREQYDEQGREVRRGGEVTEYEKWALYPAEQGMNCIPGGLSGMLKGLCGYQLDKTCRISHWEQRPLKEEQELYA
ncbi:hypothetical protein BX616_000789, partial [Lobosporangium transversale]